jgi:hypothetical protein
VPASKKKVVKTLRNKLRATQRQGDHEFYYVEEEGDLLGVTKVSLGELGEDISDEILSRMAHGLGLKLSQFKEYLACTKFRGDYVEKVRSGRDLEQ